MGVKAKLTYDLDDGTIKRASELMRQFGKEADLTEDEINDLTKSLQDMGRKGRKSTDEAKNSIDGLSSVAKKVGPAIVALFAVDKIMDFTKRVIDLTAEAQKMEAVLENALGSRSAARVGMSEIIKLAIKSNFGVTELTQSYVKLVNQGFKPSMDEMRRMQDLANSTGKQMDQLVEAIIDGQVGEFERLKEFGIRASKEGDKVVFTFKGVETQVDFTNDAIRDYIVSLGDVEGVSGSTEKISKTLGGSISNLGDSFENLLIVLGSIGSPVIISGIEMLSSALSGIADTLISDEQKSFNRAAEAFREMGGDALKLAEAEKVLAQLRQESNDMIQEEMDAQMQVTSDAQQSQEAFEAINALKLSGLETTKDEAGEQKRLTESLEDNAQLLQIIADHIEKLKKEQGKIVTVPDIDEAPAVDAMGQIELAVDNVQEALERLGEQVKVALPRDFSVGVQQAIRELIRMKEEQLLIASDTITLALTLGDSLNQINEEKSEEDLARMQADMDRRLTLVGDNEAAKDQIRAEFAERERQMEEEAAEARNRLFIFEQLAAIGDVWLNTSLAVAKAIAFSPVTFGEPWATYARIQGGIQAAFIGAQTLPAFHTGTESVDGPGGSEVFAKLLKKERVVDVARNRRIGNLSNEELTQAAEIYRSIPVHLRGDLWQAASQSAGHMSTERLEQEISSLHKTLRDKSTVNVSIDGHGVGVSVTQQQNRTRFLQKQFGIRIRS